jgi:hypothetical protein
MIEGLEEWEAEEAKRRAESYNKEKMDKVREKDSLKVGSIMTEEEMEAEAKELEEEEEQEEE